MPEEIEYALQLRDLGYLWLSEGVWMSPMGIIHQIRSKSDAIGLISVSSVYADAEMDTIELECVA